MSKTLLAQLEELEKEGEVSVDGHSVRVTNPDRELWPAHGDEKAVCKRDLLAYFVRMAPEMLPHLKDKPLTLVRMPAGLEGGKRFYQRHWNAAIPPYVESTMIFTELTKEPERYLLANNLATLLWLGQNSILEIHTWYSRGEAGGEYLTPEAVDQSSLDMPDVMVFDLDPSVLGGKRLDEAAFERVRKTALALRGELDALGLKAWLKTSGKSGIHLSVPIKREYHYDEVRAFSEKLARILVEKYPELITLERLIEKRGEKVYFDYHQNGRGKSLAAIYSPRAAEGAPVSYPFSWDELDEVWPSAYRVGSVSPSKDLWKEVLTLKQELPV